MSVKVRQAVAAALLTGGLVAGAQAGDAPAQWIGRAGILGVFPESNNLKTDLGTVDVDNSYSAGFNLTYMATPQIGLEIVGAWPFKHDIEVAGDKVGSTYQLPPTLFVQYHFAPTSSIRPYAGLGLNYTYFWDEKTQGALKGKELGLSSSWGLAGEVGVDIDLNEDFFLNGTVSYMDIDTKVKADGAGLGTASIDPWVFGLMVGTRF